MNKINMLKAVYFLYTQVPEEQFDMEHYRNVYKNKLVDNRNPICETIGCAAGWLTAIVPLNKILRYSDKTIDYSNTIASILDINISEFWFLFRGLWQGYDNTIEGACKRFLYLLITDKLDLKVKFNHPYHKIDIVSTYNKLKAQYENFK